VKKQKLFDSLVTAQFQESAMINAQAKENKSCRRCKGLGEVTFECELRGTFNEPCDVCHGTGKVAQSVIRMCHLSEAVCVLGLLCIPITSFVGAIVENSITPGAFIPGGIVGLFVGAIPCALFVIVSQRMLSRLGFWKRRL
jgi:hypothetical protein